MYLKDEGLHKLYAFALSFFCLRSKEKKKEKERKKENHVIVLLGPKIRVVV